MEMDGWEIRVKFCELMKMIVKELDYSKKWKDKYNADYYNEYMMKSRIQIVH